MFFKKLFQKKKASPANQNLPGFLVKPNNVLMGTNPRTLQDKYKSTVFGSNISSHSIASVTFVDTLKNMPDTAWDVSDQHDGSVMAWTEQNNRNVKLLDLFIGANGVIKGSNCDGMFYNYSNLTKLDLSNFDTGQVTDMKHMFASCGNLTKPDVSNFNTGQVTDMRGMFEGCKTLTKLDVSNFDTSQVTDMSNVFFLCENLTELDVSSFDTGKVTNMENMFGSCKTLTKLDVSNFDTGQVTRMNGMFQSCSSLTSLDLSNFDTGQVTEMGYMFALCSSLASLDVSSFDTGQVTNMNDMFGNCSSLTSLDVSNFDTGQVTIMNGMFHGCENLTKLDLSNFDTGQVTGMLGMFEDCGITAEEAGLRKEEEERFPYGAKPGTILRECYTVERWIGWSSTGMESNNFIMTYVGYDRTLECRVAIREYFPEYVATRHHNKIPNYVQWNTKQFDREKWQEGCENFLKAARQMEKLAPLPGIARVRDTFEENQTAYIIMDYIEGETLKQKLTKTGIMKFTECLQLLTPMMESLEKMHRQGFIHGNINLNNIMIQPDGSACLLDFDAAKNLFEGVNLPPHLMVISNRCRPQEQYMKKGNIGSWTDVYALCAAIYYCVTGKWIPDALDRMFKDTLTFDLPMSEPLSEAVTSALRDGLKLRLEERIQTVESLLERLEG